MDDLDAPPKLSMELFGDDADAPLMTFSQQRSLAGSFIISTTFC